MNRVADAEGVQIGIIAPDGKPAMVQHSLEFPEAGIPHIFDPGQAMPMFDGEELRGFIERADWIVMNDYEYQLVKDRTGLSGKDIAERVRAFVVTLGGEGSNVYERGEKTHIKAAEVSEIMDPTGCGDAYRAGMLHGLLNDMDLVTACRIGSVMGAIKIEHLAPQHHRPDMQEISDRFEAAYGYRFE